MKDSWVHSDQHRKNVSDLKKLFTGADYRSCKMVKDYLLLAHQSNALSRYYKADVAEALGVTAQAVAVAHSGLSELGVKVDMLDNDGRTSALKWRILDLHESGRLMDMHRSDIARELGVRPDAVTKAICVLRDMGYEVEWKHRWKKVA